MTHIILTLVASDTPIDKFIMGSVMGHLNTPAPPKTKWLSPQKAVDIVLDHKIDPIPFMLKLRRNCDPHKIDMFLTHANNRRKKLLIADMDLTIVTTETLDDLSEYFGVKDEVAAITEQAMRGELDFEKALNARLALLKGLPLSVIDDTIRKIQISNGAETLVKTMKNNGAKCYLVSSGFTHFTVPIAQKLGFDGHHGNTFQLDGDTLAGTFVPPIQDKDSKVVHLDYYTHKHGLNDAQIMSIGDGANDIPMLKQTEDLKGLGIAYHAKPAVVDAVINAIRFGTLKTALYAQGYSDNEMTINRAE